MRDAGSGEAHILTQEVLAATTIEAMSAEFSIVGRHSITNLEVLDVLQLGQFLVQHHRPCLGY